MRTVVTSRDPSIRPRQVSIRGGFGPPCLLSSVVEHRSCKAKVVSSILTGGSTLQPARGAGQASGRRFSPSRFDELDAYGHGSRSAGRDFRPECAGPTDARVNVVVWHEGRDARSPAISLLDANVRVRGDVGTPAGQRAVAANDPRTSFIENRRYRDAARLARLATNSLQLADVSWADGTYPDQPAHRWVEHVPTKSPNHPESSARLFAVYSHNFLHGGRPNMPRRSRSAATPSIKNIPIGLLRCQP